MWNSQAFVKASDIDQELSSCYHLSESYLKSTKKKKTAKYKIYCNVYDQINNKWFVKNSSSTKLIRQNASIIL